MKKFIKKLLREYYDDYEQDDSYNDDDIYIPSDKPSSNTYKDFIKKLPETLTLYRILIANNTNEINKVFPGSHYSMDKNNLLKAHSFLEGEKYYLLTVIANKLLVDVKTTVS